ncbi:MAG: hypothetical protein B7X48_09840 [Acidiphilium sp. 34-60-192]|nr:MAG: hypothetical protein B7X48_09840 [Acidiphilium sp. 34-60-192]
MPFTKLKFHHPRNFLAPRIIIAKINSTTVTLNDAINVMPMIAPLFGMMHRKTRLIGKVKFSLVEIEIALILGVAPRDGRADAQMQNRSSRAPMCASSHDFTKLRCKLTRDNPPCWQLDNKIIVANIGEICC